MKPTEIIEQATLEGVILALSSVGTIRMAGDQSVVDKWLPKIRDHKPDILHELRRKYEQDKILEMLEAEPDKRYAIHVADASSDPVVVTVGIRYVATFDLEIPHKYYDGIELLELNDKYSGEKYANT